MDKLSQLPRISLLLSALVIFAVNITAQQWKIVNTRGVSIQGERDIIPDNALTAQINDAEVKTILWKAPLHNSSDAEDGVILNVMLGNGRMDQFAVFEYSMMEEALSQKFQGIKTFIGTSTSDPYRKIRIDYTLHGFRAVISDLSGKTYIDHYQRNDRRTKVIYRKKDISPDAEWSCVLDEIDKPPRLRNTRRLAGDCQFREYRLAVAATGEYTTFHGGTVALGLSAIVTAINRVNEVYEQDLSVRLLLVANNDLLIYTNSATDPYNNNNGVTMLGQNQSNVDAVIGNNNYDIGHVFSTGGGGVASLGIVCNSSLKARGVTGLPNPIGDPFYIDFVAHEMGHQFGANHTFNGDAGSCSGGNRNDATAYEPGSGSTIMAYAGICGATQNVQNNSDAYFHAISIEEISDLITQPSDCASTSIINNAPQLSVLSNYNVPVSTPLVLEASATDADADILSYCWEQFDNETGFTIPPASSNTGGAMFRSLFPGADPKRYLPSIDDIVNGTTDTWEVLPSVSRVMNFRVTVRDHALVPGCTDEENMVINTSATAGPFLVTSFNGTTTLIEGENVTITWDVANTDIAPVNCSQVDILLSRDGGYTYPTTLVSAVPNDGSQIVTIPVGTTTAGRVMVKGTGNIFFDINDTDFEIQAGSATYTISANPASGEVCNSGIKQFDILTSSIMDFSTPIDLSLSGLPAGATFNANPNPVSPGNTSTVTINNFGGNTGLFSLTITGDAGGLQKQTSYDLALSDPVPFPILSSPANMAAEESTNPTLIWNNVSGADSYDYQISTSPNGQGIVESGNTQGTSVQASTILSNLTTYYWRVRANNICGPSSWSINWSFTTSSCSSTIYNGSPIPISSSGTPTITSDIDITASGTINDLNVIALEGTHTWISDLRFTLTSPGNTSVVIMDKVCNNENNFEINFDDGAASSTIPCPPVGGGTYQPANALSAFNGEEINGVWTLTVDDLENQDGGSLNSWGIEVCYSSTCQLNVTSTASTGEGSLSNAIDCAAPGETITLSSSLADMTIDLTSSGIIIDKDLTIEANTADNIILTSSGSMPTLILVPGATLTLRGFSIQSSSASRETLLNQGSVTLDNMTIRHLMGNEQIINDAASQLTVMGTTALRN